MPESEPDFELPLEEFEFSYARSGGPGGQNVNKVNSKAVLRWAVCQSQALSGGVKERFLLKYANRLSGEGELIISSQKYRDQSRNVDDCLDKLRAMVAAVLSPPIPRKPTKPGKAAKERRVASKRQQSQRKQQRRAPRLED